MGVPTEYHEALVACPTEDDLNSTSRRTCGSPWWTTSTSTPKAVEEPLYEVARVEDLLRYREGEVLDLLLHLT